MRMTNTHDKWRLPVNSRIALLLSFLVVSSATVFADDGPIQLALFNPVQIVPEGSSVTAFRLNLIYSKNQSVTGLDLGLVNMCSGGTSKGLQWGAVGINYGSFIGWQGNWLVSIADDNMEGLQTGFYTRSGHAGGVQIGLLNMTDTMNGLQIGLLNFIKEGGFMPFFPIVNWSFK